MNIQKFCFFLAMVILLPRNDLVASNNNFKLQIKIFNNALAANRQNLLPEDLKIETETLSLLRLAKSKIYKHYPSKEELITTQISLYNCLMTTNTVTNVVQKDILRLYTLAMINKTSDRIKN